MGGGGGVPGHAGVEKKMLSSDGSTGLTETR